MYRHAGRRSAVLISLSEVTAEYLREGKRVHIDGLGYLQVTLQCPAVQSTHEIRAESIRFKSVAFRPEVELKDSLKTMTLERASTNPIPANWSLIVSTNCSRVILPSMNI